MLKRLKGGAKEILRAAFDRLSDYAHRLEIFLAEIAYFFGR